MDSLAWNASLLSAVLFFSGDLRSEATHATSAGAPARDPLATAGPEAANAVPVLKRTPATRHSSSIRLDLRAPADASVQSGDTLDPSVLGSARIEGANERSVQVSYRDVDLGETPCATDPIERELRRLWTATDVAGNTGTATQMIRVLRRSASLDVRPGACPNEYKVGAAGVLPISIAGRVDFDVRAIDVGTLQVWTEHCTDGPVAPAQTKFEDNVTPYTANDGGCHSARKDGIVDLALRFQGQDFARGLHLKSYPKDTQLAIVVTGRLVNGATFVATDSLRLK